jgi:hypothetical protein
MLRVFMTRLLSRLAEIIALGIMAVLLPLSPLASTLLSGDTGYLRRYLRTLKTCTHMLGALWRTHVVARNTDRVLNGSKLPPQRIEGACTHCGRCCVNRSCVFLRWNASGQSQCSIYNNWFWKLTSCGSYPVDGHSIEVYQCPSFKAVPVRLVRNASRP